MFARSKVGSVVKSLLDLLPKVTFFTELTTNQWNINTNITPILQGFLELRVLHLKCLHMSDQTIPSGRARVGRVWLARLEVGTSETLYRVCQISSTSVRVFMLASSS